MKRIALVVGACALMTATGAAGYELAPQSPVACWLTAGKVDYRQRDGWTAQVCEFELMRNGQPVEQVNLSAIGFTPPIYPLSTANPQPIFHYGRVAR